MKPITTTRGLIRALKQLERAVDDLSEENTAPILYTPTVRPETFKKVLAASRLLFQARLDLEYPHRTGGK